MDVGIHDKRMRALSSKKEELEKVLMNSFKRVDSTKNDNTYLENVYDEYKKHYSAIIETKNKQIILLENLIKYLEDNLEKESGEMKRNLKEEMNVAKRESQKLKKDILKLKNN